MRQSAANDVGNPGEIYSYNYNVEIIPNLQNSTYPNILTVTNFQEESKNLSIYYRSSSLDFHSYDYTYHSNCPEINTSCTFKFINGHLVSSFNFNYRGGKNYSIGTSNSYISSNDGIFYSTVVDEGNNFYDCKNGFGECEARLCWETKIRCIKYESIDIPDFNYDICEMFETNATIFDHDLNTTIDFKALTSASTDTQAFDLNFNVTEFKTSTPSNFSYEFPYFKQGHCEGATSAPFSACEIYYFNKETEHQIEFYLIVHGNSYDNQYHAQVGEIIWKNEIFLKNINKPYTKADPCLKKSASFPLRNATYESTFCCVKFTELSTTVQPTTKLSPNYCLEYTSQTSVSNDSTYLEVAYKMNSTILSVNIQKYYGPKNSSVHLEAYSLSVFGQTCRATDSNPTNLCYFELQEIFDYQLEMRTSTFPDGFNMLTIAGNNGVLLKPLLTPLLPCYTETNPYNYGGLKKTAQTSFCCTSFA